MILFAAAFLGRQDAVWIAHGRMIGTCVDIDHAKLGEMVLAYPEGWEYVHGDAFEYATQTERQWDVVSIDCPTNHFDRCAGMMDVWCRLARRAVVLGCGPDTEIVAPDGWALTERRHRSNHLDGIYWAVIEKC